jgi:hypothetical protein
MSNNFLVKLGRKFRWNLGGLLFLILLANYLSFLIRFNLRVNLSGGSKGSFYYLFSRCFWLDRSNNDWQLELLLILFFCYFLRIIIRLFLNYYKDINQRLITVYLIKKLIFWADQNRKIIVETENFNEVPKKKKIFSLVSIIGDRIPEFSQQFINVLTGLISLNIDIILEIYSLYFLIKTRNLSDSIPLIFFFVFFNLICFLIFHFFLYPLVKASQRQRRNCYQEEKKQIKHFIENLVANPSLPIKKEIFNLLDNNSSSSVLSFFILVVSHWPNLLISGINIPFLLFYYTKKGVFNWNIYLISLNSQSILEKIWRLKALIFNFLSQHNFYHNYSLIREFFGKV